MGAQQAVHTRCQSEPEPLQQASSSPRPFGAGERRPAFLPHAGAGQLQVENPGATASLLSPSRAGAWVCRIALAPWRRVRWAGRWAGTVDGGGGGRQSRGVGSAGVAAQSGSARASRAAAGGMASTASEIIAFMVSISGWVLVSSTLPTDYWKVSTIDGTVITTATYWANLWKACVTDSTGVSNCKDFPSMLALDGLHPRGPRPRPSLLDGQPAGRPLVPNTPSGTPGLDSSEARPVSLHRASGSRGRSLVPVLS